MFESNDLVYMKPNVQAEPLVDQWYAWPHLIPPATTARNITHRHLKIMDSYIMAPKAHENAVKNPSLRGGPFMEYESERVDEVKLLRDRTKQRCGPLFELSDAIEKLASTLRNEAKGFSLEPMYPLVPDVLRGYVELTYDLEDQPSFRLLESLLYRSRYYDESLQSLMFSLAEADHRPFVLSTPRLEDDKSLHLRIPFKDERVDRMMQTSLNPQPWKELSATFPELTEDDRSLFAGLFTTEPPTPYQPYTGAGARWRYFGHACILVESAGMTLLFDPVISYDYEADLPRYTYNDLPEQIDWVLITHNHQDHILLETLLQIRHRVKNIAVPRSGVGSLQDPSLKLMFQNIGFKNVYEIDELETIATAAGTITGIPFLGEHADLSVRSKMAYLVKVGRHRLLFAADSRNIEPRMYEHLYESTGPVDALFVGMECDGAPLSWLYGPLITMRLDRSKDQSRRLSGSDFEQAAHLVRCFQCKEVYVYAMGQEPWLNHIMNIQYTEKSRPIVESNRLIATCHEKGITAERLYGEKEILLDSE